MLTLDVQHSFAMLSLNEHKSILVIYDALEMFRQPHADNHSFMEGIISNLFTESQAYSCEFAHGNHAEEILNKLNETKHDLIVLASNAIIRRDSNIYKILNKNKDSIEKFISSGRSLVVFHQGFAGVNSDVDFLEFAGAKKWVYADMEHKNVDFEVNLEHPIMQFPNRIDKESFIDNISRSQFYLCYYGIELSSEIADSRISKVVWLKSPSPCVALMTYENNGRLVLCPYPADWIKDEALTSNIFYYAIYGVPKIVSINKHDLPNEEYYNMLSTRISGIETITKFYDIDNIENDSRFNYLAQHAKLFIFPSKDLKEKYLERDIMKRAVKDGAKLVVADSYKMDDTYVENLNILIGRTNYNENNIVFNTILSNLKLTNWFKNALLHDIHDLLLSVYDASFNNNSDDLEIFDDKISKFKDQIHERSGSWLKNNSIEQDPITAIMAVFLVRISDRDKKIDNNIIDRLRLLMDDERCKDFKITLEKLVYDEVKDPCNLSINSNNEDSNNTLGTIVRRLDDINMCRILGEKIQISPQEYERLYLQITKGIKERPNFFDKSDSTIPTIVSITRFLLNIPSNSHIKMESNILLNDFVRFLSNYSSQINEQNYSNDINSNDIVESSEEVERDKGISELSLLMSLGILLKVDNIYPRGLFETLALTEEFDDVSYNSKENLELLYKGIRNRDYLIQDLKSKSEEFKAKTDEEISQMRKRSMIGGAAVILSIVFLIGLNVYFVLKALLSRESGFTEELGILIGLLPITIAYITYVTKSKLYLIK